MIWVWLVIFVVMIFVEFATPSALVSIWFAVGALVSMILAVLDINIWIQLIVFAVVSVLALVLLRPLLTRYIKPRKVPTNYDAVLGKMAVVTEEITENKWGHVSVQGTDWSAKSEDGASIDVGTQVTVLAVEGAKLIVKK